MSKIVEIGKVIKTHGYKGAIKIAIEDLYVKDFLNAPAIFMNRYNEPEPFFISTIHEIDTTQFIITLDDVLDKETAKPLISSAIHLREKDVTAQYTETTIIGYSMEDKNLGSLGKILKISNLPQQEIASVEMQGKEILIPLHPDFIIDVNDEKKKVFVNLPKGLIDIYIS